MNLWDVSDEKQYAIFSRLLALAKGQESAFLLTPLTLPVGAAMPGTMPHLLLDAAGTRSGGFPGDLAAMECIPEVRFLKPAQVLTVPGGEHPVLLEWLHPAKTVYIFGGGHVGVCVAHLADYVHFRVVALDDREEFVSRERFPSADERIALESFPTAFSHLHMDQDSYVVIVTRGHSHDRTILAQALRTDASYIGMIGSKRKNHLIFQALLREGFTAEDLQRVHAPIGLPIGGETPEEIGVSIVAEMIQARNLQDQSKKMGAHTKDRAD